MPARTRRGFLTTAGASGAAVVGGWLAGRLPPVSADDAKLDPNMVRLDSGIEPLVRLLELTPRDELLRAVAVQIHRGTAYRDILAALLLAGVRNVQPRPSVGFKFHAVLVVNSAHLASLSSPASDRWLPIFWALDYFKAMQEEEERTSGWKLRPVDEQAVPPASQARAAFVAAMDTWDEPAADAAVTSLARNAGAHEVFELFCRYGARDYRSIGHKAIFVANSWRTLQCIGWQHAEPVLRSLASALLNRESGSNPATSDLPADRPWRRNLGLQANIRSDWQDGKSDSGATRQLLATLHQGSSDEVVDQVVSLLNTGLAPQSVWDAVFVGAGELLMRQPGIIGLHTLTTANALYYAYRASGDDSTRRLLMLQSCAFLPLFRESAVSRGDVRATSVAELQPVELSHTAPEAALEEIFAAISQERSRAAGKILAYRQGGGTAEEFAAAARRLVFVKGNDAHDYKFSSAVLEDYAHVSPEWRDLFLALGAFNLPGSEDRDNELVARTRDALM